MMKVVLNCLQPPLQPSVKNRANTHGENAQSTCQHTTTSVLSVEKQRLAAARAPISPPLRCTPQPPMGAPMGGCGGPHGGLWGSTALIAPDAPWCRLGPKKDTESVSAS